MSAHPFDIEATDLPSPWTGRLYDQIGSTSDEALALVKAGDITTPTLFLTDHQTAGRGRGARRGQLDDDSRKPRCQLCPLPHIARA